MAETAVKTLQEVAGELGLSYKVAWSAAQKGLLPAVQPFGRGTTWCVAANYREILEKNAGGAGKQAEPDTNQKNG